MSEFILGLQVVSTIFVGSFAATMGAWAGIHAASWLFGPFNINIGPIKVTAASGEPGE